MKKKLFTLLLCAFAVLGAKAVSVEKQGDWIVVSELPGNESNMDNWGLNDTQKSYFAGGIKLKLVGNVSDADFSALKGKCNPVSLDLSEAMLAQSQLNDLSDQGNTTTGGQRIPSDWNNSLVNISLPTNRNFKNLGEDFCNGLLKLKSVVIPSNIEVIGDNAFSGCQALESVTFSSPSKLKVIAYHAFYQTKLSEVSIPATVSYVGKHAFSVIGQLKQVVFADVKEGETPSNSMHVITEAFFNSQAIADVYIENEQVQIECDNGAFDFRNTWGQGDPTLATTTLHFPQKYVRNYANLGHPLTMEEAGDPAKFHNWLMVHYSQAQDATNGWYEFKSNGTIDPDPGAPEGSVDKFLRTYCDMENDRLVPEGVKAYIVNSINSTTYEITLKQLFAIPKGTGVILYGEPNSKDKDGNKILSMNVCQISDSQPLCRKDNGTFEEEDGNYWINYLVPTGKDGVDPGPYEADGNTVTYRNFCLGRNSLRLDEHTSNPYVGFFRLRPGMISGGKAYLKLSATEYPYSTGGEVIVIGDTEPMQGYGIMHYQVEYSKTEGTPIGPETSGYWKGGVSDGENVTYGSSTVSRPNMYWAKDSNWGNRGSATAHIAMFYGEPEVTGINGATENSIEGGSYYSIEGVKTVNPQKGIYIKNGKKVVIK